jgi:hypothetical protein
VPREVHIEHRYPRAKVFLAAHGHQGVAVLHALLQSADIDGDTIVASGSTREIALRSELVSKDTAHRRIRNLQRAGVLERIPSSESRSPVYLVHLDGLGITVTVIDDRD